jgi:ABC-type sugar transport system substrate-binding protein
VLPSPCSAAWDGQERLITRSIYFVGCAAPTGFHGYLARGAAEAGRNLGAKVTYISPDQLTIPNQVEKIEEAIAAKADGIALCAFAEDAAYTEVVARAKDATSDNDQRSGPLSCASPG